MLHGKGPSPEKVSWLWEPLKEFGDVEVPPFDYSVEEGLQLALRESFDLVAGHSRGGTIALLAAAKKGRPVIKQTTNLAPSRGGVLCGPLQFIS